MLRRKKFKKGKVLHSISSWKFQARISKANPWQDFKFMHMAKPITTTFDNQTLHISGTLSCLFFDVAVVAVNPLSTLLCSLKHSTEWNHFGKLIVLSIRVGHAHCLQPAMCQASSQQLMSQLYSALLHSAFKPMPAYYSSIISLWGACPAGMLLYVCNINVH